MLWVYGHYIFFYFFRAGTDFIRQNLTSAYVKFWRLSAVPAERVEEGQSFLLHWNIYSLRTLRMRVSVEHAADAVWLQPVLPES